MTFRPLFITLLLSLCLTACQRQNQAELTLVAQNIALQTQIAAVRQTATVDNELLQITVEYMGTLVGRAQEQRGQLQATQVAQSTVANNNTAPTQLPIPDGASTPLPVITPSAPADESSTDGTPALIEPMMAPGVGSDDCAVNPTNAFTTDTAEIYIVARGVNIPPGTNIAARFAIAGQEIRHDFTPDFTIENDCVWFYIDQSDLTFTAGTWSVQLELNNAPVSAPIPFTIDDMSDAG